MSCQGVQRGKEGNEVGMMARYQTYLVEGAGASEKSIKTCHAAGIPFPNVSIESVAVAAAVVAIYKKEFHHIGDFGSDPSGNVAVGRRRCDHVTAPGGNSLPKRGVRHYIAQVQNNELSGAPRKHAGCGDFCYVQHPA